MSANNPIKTGRNNVRGVAIMEVLVTVIIFSIGMLGVFAMQIASKKTNHEAAQRSEAALVANDILQRIQNSGMSYAQIKTNYFDNAPAFYKQAERVVIRANDMLQIAPENCDANDCTPAQLAAFDLIRWHRTIKGSDVTVSGVESSPGVPGLSQAIGCLYVDGNKLIQVAVAWRAMSPVKRSGSLVNEDTECLHPDLDNEQISPDPEVRKSYVRQVVVKTYM